MFRISGVASIALAAISSVAIASAASADGGSLKDGPSAADMYLWDGLYVGAGVGAGSFDRSVSVDASRTKTVEKRYRECEDEYPELEAAELELMSLDYYCREYTEWSPWHKVWSDTQEKSLTSGDDDWDAFGTVKIGYDRLIHQRFLIGAFADFDFYSDSEHRFSEDWYQDKEKIGSIDGNFEIDNVLSVGARGGFLITPRVLAYAVGGYSWANVDGNVDVSFDNYHGGPTTLKLGAPDHLEGYFVGGGAELKLRRNLSLQIEYRYTDLDAERASASYKPEPDIYSGCDGYCETKVTKAYDASAAFDGDIQSVRVVLVLKLGEPERPVEPLK